MKYPVILVHGIVIKDFLFIKAFGKIENKLRKEGYLVFTSKTDGFGTIEHNASILKMQIEKILDEYQVDKVNIIAHSKGGLDSKYMIKHLNMEDKVASLTTLCTPHKGSKIADNILKLPNWIIKFLAFWINLFYRICKDKKPNCIEVAKQLSTINSIEEETICFSNNVYCQSYSTTLKKSRDDFIMGIPLIFSKKFENDLSDGLVSKESSKFENYRGDCINESISHSEIIDYSLSKKKREKVRKFYIDLCKELETKGF